MSDFQHSRSGGRDLFDELPTQVSTLFTFAALGAVALAWMFQPAMTVSSVTRAGDDDAMMCRAEPAFTSPAVAGHELQGIAAPSEAGSAPARMIEVR